MSWPCSIACLNGTKTKERIIQWNIKCKGKGTTGSLTAFLCPPRGSLVGFGTIYQSVSHWHIYIYKVSLACFFLVFWYDKALSWAVWLMPITMSQKVSCSIIWWKGKEAVKQTNKPIRVLCWQGQEGDVSRPQGGRLMQGLGVKYVKKFDGVRG